MPAIVDIDSEADGFGRLLGELTSKPALFEGDIHRLRHAFYRRDAVDRRLAAEIFHANRAMRARDDGWTELYLEALTDFFLDCRSDGHVLLTCSETTLLAWLGDGVSIDNPAERRLCLRILLKAADTPKRLEQRLLDAVSENFLQQSECWLGGGYRTAGVIGASDIHLIRRMLHGAGGQYPRKIRRSVIAFLLHLDRNASHFANPEGWRRLLVASVVRHLSSDLSATLSTTAASKTDILTALSTLLDNGYSPEEAARLRNDVVSAAQAALSLSDGALPSSEAVSVS